MGNWEYNIWKSHQITNDFPEVFTKVSLCLQKNTKKVINLNYASSISTFPTDVCVHQCAHLRTALLLWMVVSMNWNCNLLPAMCHQLSPEGASNSPPFVNLITVNSLKAFIFMDSKRWVTDHVSFDLRYVVELVHGRACLKMSLCI